jgi:hypothetical protein
MMEKKMILPPWTKSEDRRRFPIDRTNVDNQARYTVLKSSVTGKVIIIDSYKKRYDHMRERILSWANSMKDTDGEKYYRMLSLTYDVEGTKINPVNWKPNDIRDFELNLRNFLKDNFPDVILLGYAWVGEVMPVSKNYHYHLVMVTDRRVYLPDGVIPKMWGKGFVKITEGKTAFYLVAYTKKKNQKDYFYFPWGARGFGIWVSPCAMSGEIKSSLIMKFRSLKIWQMNYLMEHRNGDDLTLDLEVLSGVRAPPSEWIWMGSWVKLEKAENQVTELMSDIHLE